MASARILVLSYYNDPNFGDRLGYHLVNSAVPPSATVFHASVKPWTAPDEPFDLLILGIGNSLNSFTVRRDELFRLVDRIPRRVGIFGIQYPHHFGRLVPLERLHSLLDRLDYWFARYGRDIEAFGQGRDNVLHLGDWLIDAFPMATWRISGTMTIPPEIKKQTLSLDRIIQEIQRYRYVKSARLHPLLCALTSAERVMYQEQREDRFGQISGKFASMLVDVFGREYPPGRPFPVHRESVVAYKCRVRENIETLRTKITDLLDSPGRGHP